MKINNGIWIFSIAIIGISWLTISCKKDETKKIGPIITWENPDDISYGTLLSAAQLDATADVPGTFVYTPTIGAKLNAGKNQDLKVYFEPNNTATYNSASKTVKINVVEVLANDGVSSTLFNSNKTYGTMTDKDGNVYKTITIGTQTWMAENLLTTQYRNGDLIPHVTENTNWAVLSSGAYCNYDNTTDKDKIATYGRLYNWYAISDSRNIAPVGWHVPSITEWSTLIAYLGGENIAGGKLKEIGTKHWLSPNTNATNESGFSGLPAGWRGSDGVYYELGYGCPIQSSTEYSTFSAWYLFLSNSNANANITYDPNPGSYIVNWKAFGKSVRCIKD